MKLRTGNYRIKCVLVIVLVLITTSVFSTTYYVSNYGNDSNSGITSLLPWKSLSKVNSFIFKAGDQILFERGGSWYGSLTISSSGSSGSPITYGAFGTGTNPVISGFTQVTAWTNLGANIWESTNAVSSLNTCNMVSLNGINTPMGRTPNSGYYYFQSHSSNTSITSNNLSGVPNWTGAELAFNNNAWETRRVPIISHSGSTLVFKQIENFLISADNLKFIIQNDIRTLDMQNEWYYNTSTKKISIYSTFQPGSVKISSVDRLITIIGKSYISFQDLVFEGANTSAISLSSVNNIVIKNCQILFTGEDAIYGSLESSTGLTVENCSILDSNNGAIGISSYFTNAVIRQNTITNSGMIYGASSYRLSGKNEAGACYGISAIGNETLIEYNAIENTGHVGIRIFGNNTTVQKNLIRNFCQVNLDGGGIYLWNGSNILNSGRKILNNILINNTSTVGTASGIYLDDYTNGVELSDNTLITNNQGIYLHNCYNTLLQRNTVYDSKYGIRVYYNSSLGTMYNNIIRNNKVIAKNTSQFVFFADPAERMSAALTSNNNLWTRPISEAGVFKLFQRTPSWASYNYSIAEWYSYSGQDANSTKSPQSISNENDMRIEYNASKSILTIQLPYPMIDLNGIKYSSSVTLQPYTSIFLLKDNNPIVGDVIAPVINSFAIPTTSSSLTVPISVLTASDNIGITGYMLTESTTRPSATATGWSASKPTSYTFSSAGLKTLYAWAKDADGNVSSSLSSQVTITLTLNTLGNTEVYGGISTAANRRAMPVTFTEASTIQSITIYHNGGTGNVLLGVYSDQSGLPANQLGITPSTAINSIAGWQTVSLASPVKVNAGQTVWLAWVFQNNPGVRYISGTPGRAQSTSSWSAGMPASFDASTIANNKFSIYCTYTLNNTITTTNDLGNTEVFGGVSTTANRRAMPVTFNETGSIQSISIYHNGGTGNLLLGVYSDQSGSPTSLLGTTATTVINATAGWQTVTLANPVVVNSGQTVWLAWVFQNNPGVRYMAGTPGRAQSNEIWSGTMPLTFGASSIAGNKFSIFCTYTTTTINLKSASIFEVTDSVSDSIENKTENILLSNEGLQDTFQEADFKLYPNPAKTFVVAEFESLPESGTKLEIVDSFGRKIYEKPILSFYNRIETSSLTSGIYFIKIYFNNDHCIKKLIIQ